MPSLKRIILVRVLEKVALVALLVMVGGAYYVAAQSLLTLELMLLGGLLAVLLVGVIIYTQHKVGQWLTLAVQQTSFTSSEEFTSLFDHSPVAYLTIEATGAVARFNQAAVKLLSATGETMGRVNFYQRILPSEEFDASVLEEKIKAGLTINDTELRLQTAVGGEVWVLASVYTYQNNTQRLVALVDVTEQKAVDTAKSEFVALATHQLRTPIAAIRWNVELLQKSLKELADEKQTRYLEKINRNVLKMIALINDFLSVSKLEMGTFAAQTADFNLSEFFDSILDEFSEKITQKQLRIERSDQPEQAVVQTDSRLFHIIVSNLVSNAVKYIHNQGVLTLSYTLQAGKLRIVVADTGIGIPASELDKLFAKFFRASNAQAHQTEGTGLGLYVVKQSVEKLGGTISVTSVENEGTTFTVILPMSAV